MDSSEAALPHALKGLLVRTGHWSITEAVDAVRAATLVADNEDRSRYLEHGLRVVSSVLDTASLPDLVRAVSALGVPLQGRLAVALVRRLVAAGQIEEATRAARLASTSGCQSLALKALAPRLAPEDRDQAVEAAWEQARAEMAHPGYDRASACADWASLLPFFSPET